MHARHCAPTQHEPNTITPFVLTQGEIPWKPHNHSENLATPFLAEVAKLDDEDLEGDVVIAQKMVCEELPNQSGNKMVCEETTTKPVSDFEGDCKHKMVVTETEGDTVPRMTTLNKDIDHTQTHIIATHANYEQECLLSIDLTECLELDEEDIHFASHPYNFEIEFANILPDPTASSCNNTTMEQIMHLTSDDINNSFSPDIIPTQPDPNLAKTTKAVPKKIDLLSYLGFLDTVLLM